jgi:hypothetical protein
VNNAERRNSGISELVILRLSVEIREREREYQPLLSISGPKFEFRGEFLLFGNSNHVLPPSP